MPWQEVTKVSLKQEFVLLAGQEGANIAKLCRRFNISRQAGYEALERYKEEGLQGLEERSRRPLRSPSCTPDEMRNAIVQLRKEHPAWGGRKLRKRLLDKGLEKVPSASTITEILRREGLLDKEQGAEQPNIRRFEHEAPNRLWQMDFKGHFALEQGRCHPLTILDDHSRFSLCLKACGDERSLTVKGALTEVFHRYGLPERMLMDNGAPWGYDLDNPFTALTVWLIRLGIRVSHGKPYHPQTQGKEERFHRTLVAEVLRFESFRNLRQCQDRFDHWRNVYNYERPHEALALEVPASRYRPSWRSYPEVLPAIEYGPDDIVRKVDELGRINFQRGRFRVGRGFKGLPVALRPTQDDGKWQVYFCHELVTEVDLRKKNEDG